MGKEKIKVLLDENSKYRKLLFPKGFLVTDDDNVDMNCYPFYNAWNKIDFCDYHFIIHPDQRLFTIKIGNVGFALIGHAYNPLGNENEFDENVLIENAINFYQVSFEKFISYFNNWTGIFTLFIIENEKIKIFGDASGMLTTFYGVSNNHFYCSSHSNLIGDICSVEFSNYVKELVNYRFYHLFGKCLPGDISPYDDFKRLIPNHYVELNNNFVVKRFFPTSDNALVNDKYDNIVDNCYNILSSSMKMIYKKWEKPAISLTGGCDSKTTLSCTNGVYDKYSYYSYSSSETEQPDAQAAKHICEKLNLKHTIYTISNVDSSYEDIEIIRAIMEYNSGSIGKDNPNDVRKRAFFINNNDFDVEVKSWVSEVGRAYYHKRFNKKSLPSIPTPQYLTALYKVFFFNKYLIKQTNQKFNDYLTKYYTEKDFDLISWYDLMFWEFRVSSWNGLVITGEHQISGDITIPYNNRVLLQNMISVPLEYRINDKLHKDIMKKANDVIYNCNISVNNVKHTKMRANFEKMYLDVFSKLF